MKDKLEECGELTDLKEAGTGHGNGEELGSSGELMVGVPAMAPNEEVWHAHIPVILTAALLSIIHLSPGQSSQLGQLGSQAHPLSLLWQGEENSVGGGVL